MPDAYAELSARTAAARERFLASQDLTPGSVREQILNSWRRSRFWEVDADRLEPPYRADVDLDSRLARSATPVLDRLERELADAPMTIVLADPRAWVLDRRAGDRSLLRKLDAVSLAPGFSYAEQFVGTNGIGTALEERTAASVSGHEHFSERLQALSCAGAVIRNPLRGRVEGVIDLSCWWADGTPLMRVLVQEAARDIARRLAELESERERALLQEFMAACRRTRNPVLSYNDDLVITNGSSGRGVRLLEPGDQLVLRERAAELLRSAHETTADLRLPSGRQVRLRYRPVAGRAGVAGGLVEIEGLDRGARRRSSAGMRAVPLTGLAGRSPAWLETCQDVAAAGERRVWLLLTGEAGVGKLALARAVHHHHHGLPPELLRVLDAPGPGDGDAWLDGVRSELDRAEGTIVVRHVDRLEVAVAEALAAELGRAGRGAHLPWVVGTSAAARVHDALAEHFAASVAVPPLRYRIHDLHELVALLLERHAPGAAVRCTPAALRTLMLSDWPGNVGQLEQTLRAALARRRNGRIDRADLPADCHAVTRRVLTRLQWIERDAILEALLETRGNRTQAAAKLGISRATVYRKISAFGIRLDGLHD